jgi:hypothetical protein
MVSADQAEWTDEWERERHFRKHGAKLGRKSVSAYDLSARATIRAGKRFTYQDAGSGERRVGYYHQPTKRLTVLAESEERIVTHFRCDEGYVRGLRDTSYRPRGE